MEPLAFPAWASCLALVTASLLVPALAQGQEFPCDRAAVRHHELIGSSPGGDAWAVREVYTLVPPEKESPASPAEAKGVYPKIKGRENFGTTLFLCRAGVTDCQAFAIYEKVEPEEGAKAKTTEAQAAKSLAAAKKAFAEAKVDLNKPGRALEPKGAALHAGQLAALKIEGGATARLSKGSLGVEAPQFGKVLFADKTSSDEKAWAPVPWLSADGDLLFWAIREDLCGDEESFAAAPLKSVAAYLFQRRAAERYKAQDYAAAADDFAAAWTLEPRLSRAGLAAGYALLLAGKRDEATAVIQKALLANPGASLPAGDGR